MRETCGARAADRVLRLRNRLATPGSTPGISTTEGIMGRVKAGPCASSVSFPLAVGADHE